MKTARLPITGLIGIEKSEKKEYIFKIRNKPEFHDHLHTVHSSIIFALAEATSYECLTSSLGEYTELTVPVLHKANTEFTGQGTTALYSRAEYTFEETERLLSELDEKGRCIMIVPVSIFDDSNIKIFMATFEWGITLKK